MDPPTVIEPSERYWQNSASSYMHVMLPSALDTVELANFLSSLSKGEHLKSELEKDEEDTETDAEAETVRGHVMSSPPPNDAWFAGDDEYALYMHIDESL